MNAAPPRRTPRKKAVLAAYFFGPTCDCADASSCASSPTFLTMIEILRLDGLVGSSFNNSR
jgi:hypothetical protein